MLELDHHPSYRILIFILFRMAHLNNMSNMNMNMNMNFSNRPLADLPLRPSTMALFQTRGFTSVQEVKDSCKSAGGGMSNLAQELDISIAQAAGLWREVQGCCTNMNTDTNSNNNSSNTHNATATNNSNSNTNKSLTAASALIQQQQQLGSNNSKTITAIITFSRGVDELTDGGLALGELTEIAGLPGAGKTQWGMQLAVNARLPATYGGCQGETVYVDTEGSFSPERALQMSQALVQHIDTGRRKRQQQQQGNSNNNSNNNNNTCLPAWFTPESILEGIHVYRVHDAAAQTAALYSLPTFLKERQAANAPVRLIVVDSMAFHFRAALVSTATTAPATTTTTTSTAAATATTNDNNTDTTNYYMNRTRILTAQAAFLAQLAVDFQVAVVTMNQMTTQFSASNNNSNSTSVVPALGESWAHAVTTRLLLSANANANATTENTPENSSGYGQQPDPQHERSCQLIKSPRLPSGQADYCITAEGVRSIKATRPTSAGGGASKRLRTA
jgi:RAD51-like protein 2